MWKLCKCVVSNLQNQFASQYCSEIIVIYRYIISEHGNFLHVKELFAVVLTGAIISLVVDALATVVKHQFD